MTRIVIADDEPITRMDIAAMLTELGYEVAGEAADGFDAVELCRREKPDVAILDVKMPVFDGLSAAGLIVRDNLAGAVVLLTAFNDETIVSRATEIGVSGYLVKPVEQRLLRPAIEVARAQSERLKASRQETEKAEKQLKDSRLIARAQAVLAKSEHISESEAYTLLRRMSMEKRVPMVQLAKAVLVKEKEFGNDNA